MFQYWFQVSSLNPVSYSLKQILVPSLFQFLYSLHSETSIPLVHIFQLILFGETSGLMIGVTSLQVVYVSHAYQLKNELICEMPHPSYVDTTVISFRKLYPSQLWSSQNKTGWTYTCACMIKNIHTVQLAYVGYNRV